GKLARALEGDQTVSPPLDDAPPRRYYRRRGIAIRSIVALFALVGLLLIPSLSLARPEEGLDAHLALQQLPAAGTDRLFLELSLRNVSSAPIHLAGWRLGAWSLLLSSSDTL